MNQPGNLTAPLESFRVNHRGAGAKQFPPHMMLALLIYSYGNGLICSCQIERATHRDVSEAGNAGRL